LPDTQSPSLLTVLKTLAVRRPKEAPTVPARVLLVDDEEPVLRFVNRVLTEAGYQTALASSGADALQVASTEGQFDLLITDVMMPEMAGEELARRLRQSDPRLKVLYLTGFSDQLFKEKVTMWEDEAFLDKPCSVKGLRQAVSLMLTGSLEQVQ
jgi:two-component system cell cycle sensor histidine kinase/response regulator CckA